MAGTFHFTHQEAGRSRSGPCEAKWAARAQDTTLTCRQEGPGGRGGGGELGEGAAAHLAAEPARRNSRLLVSGSRAQRVRSQVRAPGRAGPRGGSFLAEKGVIVCSYSWYVRRARRPRSAGEPLPGAPREREGGQGSGGGKDAGSGAHPLGAELRSKRTARERERGPGPGLWLTVASPGPDSLTTKAAAAGEPWGAAGGRTEAATRRPRVGWGGAISGRAATALRLLKSKQLLVLRAASGRPARLPVSLRTLGRLQEFRESHVFKFLWVRNLPELQIATKGRRTRRLAGRSEARAAAETRARPPPLRAPTDSLSLLP